MQSDPIDPAATLELLLKRRYSCRGFKAQPVPRPTIERILSLAQRTASWCNAQPWQVLLVSGAATVRLRNALYAHAAGSRVTGGGSHYDFEPPREYLGTYLQRRRECGLQLYGGLGIGKADKEAAALQALENFRFFGAPHVALISSAESLRTYGAVDCGAYVANFLLAAEAMGVAAIAQAALASQSAFLHEYLRVGPERRIVCGISFGYADEAHPANGFRTTRAPLADSVSWLDA